MQKLCKWIVRAYIKYTSLNLTLCVVCGILLVIGLVYDIPKLVSTGLAVSVSVIILGGVAVLANKYLMWVEYKWWKRTIHDIEHRGDRYNRS